MNSYTGLEIAVIGMSGRFPGAGNLEAFWDNLKNGMESVTFFTKEELLAAGEEPGRLENPQYVKAGAILENKDCFDGDFFGYIPSEVNLMDPQVRLFHEECWNALEDAGYGTPDPKSKIGLFAGAASNVNWEVYASLINRNGLADDFSATQLRNARFLSTRISYALNLSGPSVFIDTACSTSLVAIHQACKSLLVGDCNMAIAGGIAMASVPIAGYLYREGMINSQDGHCRAFDQEASGTIQGEGAGVVILKTLKNALKDGDHVYAVIRGSGINNDGNHKVGYTAPSIDGQALAIMTAQKWAKTAPESISYIETHGTGTSLGDPIEIAGLTKAFQSDKKQFCAIGSVKTNIGHLDTAAGVAGFIKTVLALKHRQLPPSLHFTTPNPKIDFANSPFYVNTALKDWTNNGHPLRAGVSSFGIGGTNAHVILEEAPALPDSSPGRDYQLLLFSAKTPGALQRNINRFCTWWQQHPQEKPADIAYTLQTGRASFQYRQMLVCRKGENVMEQLETIQSTDHFHHLSNQLTPQVVFMFSGQGSQYADMCRGLYEQEPVFREQVDYCCQVVKENYGKNLLSIIFSPTDTAAIDNTEYTQPALFIIEYSLARLLMSWGIRPDRMIGHSIGEYVAACISGVFSLDDALKLVVKRGELMQQVQPGKMLSVAATEEAVTGLLENHPALNLAAVNSSALCAVSGNAEAIAAFKATAEQAGFVCKPIRTSHAFHSAMMDEILGDYEQVVASVKLQAPQLPFISNVSGAVAEAALVTQSRYWVDHLRQPVQFAAGITTLFKNRESIFIEAGPGKVLSTLVQVHNLRQESHGVVSLVRQSKESGDDIYHLLQGLGTLWLQGITINWTAFYTGEQRHKISLPGYSFERTSYVATVDTAKLLRSEQSKTNAQRNITDSIHIAGWQCSTLPNKAMELAQKQLTFLVFSGKETFSKEIIDHLSGCGQQVIEIKSGDSWHATWEHIRNAGVTIDHIIYCNALEDTPGIVNHEHIEKTLKEGYLSLCELAKSLSALRKTEKIPVTVIGNHLVQVFEEDEVNPLKAALLGPVKIMPVELLEVDCKVVEIPYPFEKNNDQLVYRDRLLNELFYQSGEPVVAYRHGKRWTPSYDLLQDNRQLTSGVEIVKDGIYIITGGFGGMGLTIGKSLAIQYGARVVLVHRSAFPARGEWKEWLQEKGKEDKVSKLIEELLTVEEAGGIVELFQADIVDEKQVRGLCEYLQEKYIKINGIVWAAGEVDHGGIIQNRDEAGLLKYLGSKINGLLLFEKYLDLKKLDFLALFSSVGNRFYQSKFGQVAYNAANEFMESYAYYARRHKGIHAFAISWCDWLNVGMTVKTRLREMGNKDISIINEQIEDGIYPAEGVNAFYKCLQSKVASTIVYKGNLSEAIRHAAIKHKEAIANLKTAAPGMEEAASANSSPQEKLLLLFHHFFGNQHIKTDDDFFGLGGDSLKAMTMIGRINQKMGSSLTIADLYKNPTVAELTTLLESNEAIEVHHGIGRVQHEEDYVLSSAQKRMYLLQEMDPESIAYNEFQLLRLEGSLDLARLESTFQQLIARHESLRSAFIMKEDEPRQIVLDNVSFSIEKPEGDANNIDSITRSFIRPFDLTKAPLIRAGLINLSASEHILVVDMHHIIADGVSKGILIRDFMSLYNGQVLPELSIQYKDYAGWQQSPEEQERIAIQKAFWLQELSEELTPLDLPIDYARPVIKNESGDHFSFSIKADQVSRLQEIGSSQGASLFMVMLAVYNVLLSKLGNQEDIVVGIPSAGRRHADLEGIIGMFVNTLPVRNRPAGALSFKDFLATVKQQSLAALEHQDYQYEDMIDALQLIRDTSRNPLFDVMLSYQNYEEPSLKLPGLTVSPFASEYRLSKFDLTLDVWETGKELLLRFEYCTALFRQETIARFAGYLGQIVYAITQDADRKLCDINILSDAEKHQLLYGFNNTHIPISREETFFDLFERQAQAIPEYLAVEHNEDQLTYRELYENACLVANCLAAYDIKQNKKVALYIPRGTQMLTCILATFQVGGIYVPLDIDYPIDRINTMLLDCEAEIIITNTTTHSLITGITDSLPAVQQVICIDETDLSVYGNNRRQLSTVATSDLAYIIYTSGTTGKPKGVMIHQLGMLNHLYAKINDLQLSHKDIIAQTASPCFDISIWQFLAALLVGGKTYIIDKTVQLDARSLLNKLREGEVSIFESVPSLITSFLDGLNSNEENLLEHLRWMIPTGEALSAALIKKWYAYFPDIKLLNAYGPTEASDDVTHYVVERADENKPTVPIGKPILNTHIYILDKYLNLCPIGVKGEIFIAGLGVGRGYYKDVDKTKKAFLPNPFIVNNSDYGTMYRTGDRGVRTETGNIECAGRIDDQVKIRGFRIELGEIEHRLNQQEAIRENAVVVKEKGSDKYLVAYYVSEEAADTAVLRSFLQQGLPDYMVPAFFVHLQQLPLTSNGKLDRKSLPDPDLTSEEHYIAAVTTEQQVMVNIWQKVLGRDKVGISDNFFTIGGDSIKSIQIIARTRAAGYEVSVKDIFSSQTIEILAGRMKRIERPSDQSILLKKSMLSPVQQWFFGRERVSAHHYNQSVMLQFAQGITVSEVRSIFSKLQEHHDALRMVFRPGAAGWMADSLGISELPVSILEHDLRGAIDAGEALARYCNEVQGSIDLEKGPLMRLGLFHLEDGSRLLIVIHHLVIDGISWRILFEDIETLFLQLQANRTLSLPLKTGSFQSWPVHLERYRESTSFRQAEAYWKNIIDKPVLPLPRDMAAGNNRIKDTEQYAFRLSKETTTQLLTQAHGAFHTRINDLLLSSLVMAIHEQFGLTEIKIDLEAHGREDIVKGINISRTVGWFTSIYPVVLAYNTAGIAGHLKAVKEYLRKVPNNGLDYLLSGYWNATETAPIIFNYLGQFDADTQGKVYNIAQESGGEAVAVGAEREHDWMITGIVASGQLEINLAYSREQYSDHTVRAFMQRYQDQLEDIIQYCCSRTTPELTPSDLSYDTLSIEQLDVLQQQYPVQDIYPLSPMQEGMLFHSLLEATGNQYFEQMSYQVEGRLNIAAVEQSMIRLTNRYDVLRTMVIYEGFGRSLQLVLRERKIDFVYKDLRQSGREMSEQEVIAACKTADRNRKFDLSRDMLMRLSIYQTGDEQFLFIWSFHHIIMDGWCISILINDFKTIYAGLIEGRPVQLPPVTPFSDYIKWLQEREKEHGIKYWREYLEGYGIQTGLQKERTASTGELLYQQTSAVLTFTREQTHSLKKIAGRHGVTVNILLQVAWGILLSRYNNVNDVLFGSVVSGRPAEITGIEDMVGLFINTIPVRITMEAGDTVMGLLQRIQAEALESEPYHYHSLAEIQSVSTLGRDLLDHVIIFENYPIAGEIQVGHKAKEAYRIRNVEVFEQTNYEYALVVLPGDELMIKLDYNGHTYDSTSMQQVLVHLKCIVEQMMTDSDVLLSDISLLSEAEQAELMQASKGAEITYAPGKTIVDLLAEQVSQTPDKTAVLFAGGSMSYRQLQEQSDKIACYLHHEQGIKQGDFVGLLLERDRYLLPVLWAILKCGAAYVPLDPQYPAGRIQAIVEDGGLRAVVTSTSCLHLLTHAADLPLVDIDACREAIMQQPAESWLSLAQPTDIAYVIYTSGSTGKPKGVMVEHRSLVNYISWAADYYLQGEPAVFALYTSISFDLTVTSIYTPLVTGNSVLLYAEQEQALLVEQVFSDNIATVIKLTPSHLKVIRDSGLAGWQEAYKRKKLIVGGEQLVSSLARSIWEKFKGNIEIYNEYGPTEATVGCMIYQYDPADALSSVPIGQPIANTRIYILDASRRMVPRGIAGELYIGGAGLARGYAGNEALTADRFIADPFVPGARMYKTGDTARYLPDGRIEYIGRRDEQVKIRGFRIELGEIEHRLNRHEAITESAVIAREKGSDKYLVGYYVSGTMIDPLALRNFLQQELPDYMVPAFFVHLQQLPLTANGKLDRKSLPDPDPANQQQYVAAVTAEQQVMADIWEQVLGLDKIGISDNFFAIGGDSIKSIQIIARTRAAGYEVSVKDIFTSQTIEALASRMKQIETVSDQSMVSGTSALTPIQQWFFGRERISAHHYNQSVMLQFAQGITASEVHSIFSKLQEHHDALRMVFRPGAAGWISDSLAVNEVPVSILEHDLRGTIDAGKILARYCNEVQGSIDLSHGPLMRLGLFHLEDGSRLLIVIHHLVVDGISWRILFEDIETLYGQLQSNTVLSLPLKTDPFQQWPVHLEHYRESPSFQQAEAYWKNILDKPVLPLPRDTAAGSNRIKDTEKVVFNLSKEATTQLLTKAHGAFHTRINDLLLASLVMAIHEQFGIAEVKIDLESHGREDIGKGINISRTIGWFTSIYPVVLSHNSNGIAKHLKAIKEHLRKVPNNGLDYLLSGNWNATETSSIIFNYLGQFDTDTQGKVYSIAQEAGGEMVAGDAEREYDWNIVGMVVSGRLEMSIEYSREQYHENTISRIMHSYQAKLETMIGYCCDRITQELTPSDLSYDTLSMEQLDVLQQQYPVQDIYPLSPMQEGMLFHSLLEATGDQYFEQMSYQVEGRLNIAAVEQSMARLTNRYDVLRTLFIHEGYGRPLQLVLRERKIDFIYKDLRQSCKERGEQELIAACKAADRSRKFDLSRDMLMRLSIYQTGDEQFLFIWSFHHIIMDGWCISILINDFKAIYAGLTEGRPVQLSSVIPYSGYIKWLENREKEQGLKYWQQYLEGYETLSTLPGEGTGTSGLLAYQQVSAALNFNREQTRLLKQIAGEQGITLNTMLQVAWGILLSRYNNVSDVLFGSVVSGRPATIAGIENIVGLFINTIPVRITFEADDTVISLLQRVQAESLESEPYHYHSLAELQSLTPQGSNLLDHVIVFENYPIAGEIQGEYNAKEEFRIRNVEVFEQTSYDYALIVMPGEELVIKLDYNSHAFDKASIELILSHLKKVLEQVMHNISTRIDEIELYDEFVLKTEEQII